MLRTHAYMWPVGCILSSDLQSLQPDYCATKVGHPGFADPMTNFSLAINLPTNRNSWTGSLWTRLPLASLKNLHLHANPFDHSCVTALARVLVNKQVLRALLYVQVDEGGHLLAGVLRERT